MRWHFNEGLPIFSSIPGVDTCHSRIKRVRKQTIYNVINDFLAWGYVRKRGRKIRRNHRRGHLRAEHWSNLENIVLAEPFLFIDELRDKLNAECNTRYHYFVVQKALIAHDYTWKKIERIARQQDHVLRRRYRDLISRYKSDQIYFFDECHIDENSGQRKYGRSRRGRRWFALVLAPLCHRPGACPSPARFPSYLFVHGIVTVPLPSYVSP